jgi:DNA-binding XRE family transcriptional regulator
MWCFVPHPVSPLCYNQRGECYWIGNYSVILTSAYYFVNMDEQPTIKRFGEKMRTLRNRHGMTTRELTVALGYPAESNSYISRIETSKVVPKAEFMLRVADLFGVPIETLMRDELDV